MLTQALKQTETDREAWRDITARLEAMQHTVTQITEAVHTTQQTLGEHEILLSGRLLLLQRRYERSGQNAAAKRGATAHQSGCALASWGSTFRAQTATPKLSRTCRRAWQRENARRLALTAQCEQALGHYEDAEQRILRLIEIRGEARQDDFVTLGAIQSALDPQRARQTPLEHALITESA